MAPAAPGPPAEPTGSTSDSCKTPFNPLLQAPPQPVLQLSNLLHQAQHII